SFYVDSYSDHFPIGLFNVKNDSNGMIDYFETDSIEFYSNEKYYSEAAEGCKLAKIHYLQRSIKNTQKRINDPKTSEYYRRQCSERLDLINKELSDLLKPPKAEEQKQLNEFAAFKSNAVKPNIVNAGESPAQQRLFVDMDGTLAVFTPASKLETLYEKGYFADLAPIQNVVDSVKLIVSEHPEIEVNILSAYLSDSPYALAEKNAWLDKYLPEIDSAHRIFPPCGQSKKDYIPNGVKPTDFLLDDYTHNLREWEPPARGIKLLNGINNTHGTWQKASIHFDKRPQELAGSIVSVMEEKSSFKYQSADTKFGQKLLSPQLSNNLKAIEPMSY
ncbi:MAG: hypothetical protein RR724_06515, partial [Hydrogenoanaerobacterium sp.]